MRKAENQHNQRPLLAEWALVAPASVGLTTALTAVGATALTAVQIVFGFHVSKKRVEFVPGLLRQLIEPLGPQRTSFTSRFCDGGTGRAIRSGPRRPNFIRIHWEFRKCRGTVLRRPSLKSRVCDCCRSGTGCAVCSETRRQSFIRRERVFGFCRGSVLLEKRRPSLTGRFCDSRSGGTGRAICCGPRGPFVTCNKELCKGAFCCGAVLRGPRRSSFTTRLFDCCAGSTGRVTRSGPGGPSFRLHQDALRVRVLLCDCVARERTIRQL